MRVTNAIPLGRSLLLPVSTVKSVQTLKARSLENEARVETVSEQSFSLANEATKNNTELVAQLAATTSALADALDVLTDTKAALADATKTIGALVAALAGVPSTGAAASSGGCNGDCTPKVEADGQDVSIVAAGGSVTVETGTCGTVDLCAVKAAIEAIRTGLA
jgi:hypothetical protein